MAWRQPRSGSTSSAIGLLRTCTLRMSPFGHGRQADGDLAVEPAGPQQRGRGCPDGLVAAMTMTEVSSRSRPSRTGSGSGLFTLVMTAADAGTAPASDGSSSSMKMMAGWLAGFLEQVAHGWPTPTEHLHELRSGHGQERHIGLPATARQQRLARPGGPTSSTPLGISAPMRRYLCGCFRKSTTSFSSCLASR